MFKVPEKFRVRKGQLASDASYGNNGAFMIKAVQPIPNGEAIGYFLFCIASDGGVEGGTPWEHVSATIVHPVEKRCPTWEEMCAIKNIFWAKEDCVMQYHPPEDKYVNQHPFCLHLWRKPGFEMPIPEPTLVGMQKKSVIITAAGTLMAGVAGYGSLEEVLATGNNILII